MGELHSADQPVVLLVEDEALIRLATADHLRFSGFKVVEAATATEAQDLILAGLEVDLVFSDITMPSGLDGVGLAKWLGETAADVPVILVSGVSRALDAAQHACANVQAISAKPYDADEIVAQIRSILAARA
jgi:DNA-binding NtrC family response regulator